MLCGVPQGSVLGPLLFVLYSADLGVIVDRHGVNSHFYVDDTQLYVSTRQHDARDVEECLTECMEDITQWMASNCLKLNPAKTDFMWCATCRRQHQLSKDHVTFAGSAIRPSSTVRNLGVMLDSKLSFGPHISQLVSRCFLQLCRIKSCVQALPMDVRKTIVNSFVISGVDYCNSLLAGVPCYQLDRLQSVVNTAARLIVSAKKQDHINHVLRDRLHWLPVPQRVQFKLCLLTYKALHGLAPSYIADLCRPVTTVSSRQRLRSTTRGDLVVFSSVTHFGTRAFAVAGPKAWNQLPMHIRCTYEHGSQLARSRRH